MRDIQPLLDIFNKKNFTYQGADVNVQAVDMMGINAKDCVEIRMVFVHPSGNVFKERFEIDRYLFAKNLEEAAKQIHLRMQAFGEIILKWEYENDIEEFDEEEI